MGATFHDANRGFQQPLPAYTALRGARGRKYRACSTITRSISAAERPAITVLTDGDRLRHSAPLQGPCILPDVPVAPEPRISDTGRWDLEGGCSVSGVGVQVNVKNTK
jgi:hypothetical protein